MCMFLGVKTIHLMISKFLKYALSNYMLVHAHCLMMIALIIWMHIYVDIRIITTNRVRTPFSHHALIHVSLSFLLVWRSGRATLVYTLYMRFNDTDIDFVA